VLRAELDAQCDKLHGQARPSDVDRRKYCQLGLTDDDPVHQAEASIHLCRANLTKRCNDRHAVVKFPKTLRPEFRVQTKFQGTVTLFRRYLNFLTVQCSIG